jgi:cysteinyl-tRNA synthetase
VPFEDALNDDFNSPRALRWVDRVLRTATKQGDPGKASELAWAAVRAMRILGVDLLGTS